MDGGIRYSLSNLAHELIHVLQYQRGDLRFEGQDILWRGAVAMSGVDYAALTYAQHAALPWEREAIEQGERKVAAFLSDVKSMMKGRDSTLDYLIDHDLL